MQIIFVHHNTGCLLNIPLKLDMTTEILIPCREANHAGYRNATSSHPINQQQKEPTRSVIRRKCTTYRPVFSGLIRPDTGAAGEGVGRWAVVCLGFGTG